MSPRSCRPVGLPLPTPLAGRSLQLLFRGPPATWREYLFTEFTAHGPGFAPQRAVRDARYKLIHNLLPGEPKSGIGVDGCPIRAIIDEPRWQNTIARRVFRRMEEAPEFELYDLQEDPLENTNLAGIADVAEVEARLRAALLRWREQTHDPLLDGTYLQKLQDHTQRHLNRMASESAEAKAAGLEPPYNRIDMAPFQQVWPLVGQ